MYSNIHAISDRSLNLPQFNLMENNTILQTLRQMQEQLNLLLASTDDRRVDVQIPSALGTTPHLIGSIEHGTESFYWAAPNPKLVSAYNKRVILLTNQPAISGNDATLKFEVIGTHKPYLLKYTGTDPVIGDRLAPHSLGRTLEVNQAGEFEAIAVPETTDELVWVVFRPHWVFLREGKVTETGGIAYGASGDVTIWQNGSATSEVVQAGFVWLGVSGDTIPENAKVEIRWDIHRHAYVIYGANCVGDA